MKRLIPNKHSWKSLFSSKFEKRQFIQSLKKQHYIQCTEKTLNDFLFSTKSSAEYQINTNERVCFLQSLKGGNLFNLWKSSITYSALRKPWIISYFPQSQVLKSCALHWGVFRTLLNIYDGAFFKKINGISSKSSIIGDCQSPR